jgi:hypothetical protein
MKKYLLFLLPLLLSCEKYVTEVSDLTLSGKYVVSKVTLIQTSQATTKDTTFFSGSTFMTPYLPDPFDSIKVDNFYLHFDYSTIRMIWYNRHQNGQRDRWEYGESPNEIMFWRVPYSFDAYTTGKIQFDYKPKDRNSYARITFQVDSDLLETLQLSGLDFAPYGKDGPHYRLILSLNRVGP